MCVPEFWNYLELLGVPRETKMPVQKLGFLMTEPPGTTSAGTRIITLYTLRKKC